MIVKNNISNPVIFSLDFFVKIKNSITDALKKCFMEKIKRVNLSISPIGDYTLTL